MFFFDFGFRDVGPGTFKERTDQILRHRRSNKVLSFETLRLLFLPTWHDWEPGRFQLTASPGPFVKFFQDVPTKG